MNKDNIQPTPRGQVIQMPADTARKFRFTKPLTGGPVFDFPAFGLFGINLATLTEQQAERLLRAGWAGIERIPNSEARAAATFQKTSKSDGE